MKKSLLALAVLGAFAGAASAQSSVTIYGVADVGIERFDNDGAAGATWGLTSGNQSGSRIGFRGTEDLGGGLKANFVLENGFNIDTGTLGQGGRLFGRQAWVGLSGGFGAVKFGRQMTPIFVAHDTIDPMGTGLSGAGSGMSAVFNPYGVRMDNTVNYSFSAAGFSAEAAYGFGEVAGATSAGRQIGLGASYANGPLTVVAAYHDAQDPIAASDADARTFFVGGAFDFRVAKLHAAYGDNRGDTAAGATGIRSRDYMLGVSAPVGAGTISASYIRRDERLVADADGDYWAIAYVHSLSKRTNLYTSYSVIKNDDAGNVGGFAAGPGGDVSWFNVGIRHRF
ncbi:MAG TPA: porin [Noviherbaspirillum sp.]|jgi:predicted porin|uniref:porin n=1 Tax=Noviherbaspirillum sp. TaxID=1926288 RepID=UPI002F94F7B9